MVIDGIEYLTPDEAAAYLKVSRSRIRQLVSKGTLENRRVMNLDLVTKASVVEYAETPNDMGRPKKVRQSTE